MAFDEPEDRQTEADAKSIASKHKITLQELKEQALGSVSRWEDETLTGEIDSGIRLFSCPIF